MTVLLKNDADIDGEKGGKGKEDRKYFDNDMKRKRGARIGKGNFQNIILHFN